MAGLGSDTAAAIAWCLAGSLRPTYDQHMKKMLRLANMLPAAIFLVIPSVLSDSAMPNLPIT